MHAPPSTDDGILCCEVGRERFAFRSADVRHVERSEYLRPDNGDDGRLGTLRLGGQQVPVFGLGDVLGMTGDGRIHVREGHIAVTGDRQSLTGWYVDRIARAARPAHGDVSPLPSIVGAKATSWFEGIVWLGEDESALLLSPHGLVSPVPVDAHDDAPTFAQPRTAADSESVAVVFSTSVLPASDALRYALSGRQIAAIVQPTPPIAVPGCHDFVDGVMWWRRTAVPVLDFRARIDRHDTTHRRRLIVQCGTRQRGSLIAFSIEPGVFMCRPEADHRLLPEVRCPAFASGVFDVNGQPVALLDLDALLGAEGAAACA